MNPDSAINRLREVIRLKHLSLSTMGYLTATQCNVASPLEFIESSSSPAPAAVQTPA